MEQRDTGLLSATFPITFSAYASCHRLPVFTTCEWRKHIGGKRINQDGAVRTDGDFEAFRLRVLVYYF